MIEKLDSLIKTHTWDIVKLPLSKSVIGYKWIYKIRTQSDGKLKHSKAYLVAKGFIQEYGIDNKEIFAFITRLTSIYFLLAITYIRIWYLF